jgi:hypothetical protein
MKSLHSLIPFLSLFCSCRFRRFYSIQFLCFQVRIPADWRPETRIFSSLYVVEHFFITTLHTENTASNFKGMCLLISCLAMGLLCHNMEQLVEWELAGETEVLGENLSQYPFIHNSNMIWPVIELRLQRWEYGDNLPEIWHGPYRSPITHFNIILPFKPGTPAFSLSFRFTDYSSVYIFHLSHACYMSFLSYPTWSAH